MQTPEQIVESLLEGEPIEELGGRFDAANNPPADPGERAEYMRSQLQAWKTLIGHADKALQGIRSKSRKLEGEEAYRLEQVLQKIASSTGVSPKLSFDNIDHYLEELAVALRRVK